MWPVLALKNAENGLVYNGVDPWALANTKLYGELSVAYRVS